MHFVIPMAIAKRIIENNVVKIIMDKDIIQKKNPPPKKKERKKKEDFLKEGNREQTNHRPTSKHNSN